jgi:NitT/TauT family transport system substrate-binding protein
MDPTSAAGLAAKGEMRILFNFNDEISNFLQYAIFASNDFQAQHPDALKAFMAAWYETIQYAKDHKDETVKAISAAINVPPDVVAETYDRATAGYPTSGKFDQAMLDNMKESFVTAGFVDSAPDMSTLYTEQFLPQ